MADAVVVGQVIDYTDSVLHQYLGNTVKSSVVATIHKGLKAALGNSKRLSRGATTATPGKPPPSSSPSELLLPKQNPTFKSTDECSDADLPYAEPVQGAAADGISTCFGDKVARCLFSNAWAPRVEGLSHLQKLLQAKRCDIAPATVAAIDAVLQAALSDHALLFLSRQPLVGPVFILDAMPSLSAPSSTLLANKLHVVLKLLLEFGVHDSTGGGALGLKHVLHPALAACEHKDAAVRHAAIQIFSEAFKVARPATMPFLNGLARGAKQKLIAKLVELGVLESDLLMDEVDDFDSAPTGRPGTSGPRPPTASGSSTKHRPSLATVSVLAPPSATSSTSTDSALPYGTALTDDQRTDYARMLAVMGEPIVRCLLDKTWAPREAAVREIEKQVLLAGAATTSSSSSTATTRWATDAPTLVVLSEALELVLHDTVARVYQCALRLLQVLSRSC
ncbi:hypothetical protein DYB36_010887 [Aphanomyces astaci]|uniref:TOG domain-containing protein n=1 Tax=Aphanomyces astaci TaxID=112090 RepID=A0A397BEM3_APHAT|nr:hypothetical protein DYB36_010887 [Aphanomyces astaci]